LAIECHVATTNACTDSAKKTGRQPTMVDPNDRENLTQNLELLDEIENSFPEEQSKKNAKEQRHGTEIAHALRADLGWLLYRTNRRSEAPCYGRQMPVAYDPEFTAGGRLNQQSWSASW
jgi:hypothetical protein